MHRLFPDAFPILNSTCRKPERVDTQTKMLCRDKSGKQYKFKNSDESDNHSDK